MQARLVGVKVIPPHLSWRERGERVLFLYLPHPIPSLADEIGDARGWCEMPASGSEANLNSRL